MYLTLNEGAQSLRDHNELGTATKKVYSVFFIYISFINCGSKPANWNLVKLFLLPLIFSLFWLKCRETKSSCQKPDCTAKRCRLKCHLSTASADLFHYLFISIVATWVFVKVPIAYDKFSLFVFLYICIQPLREGLGYFTAANGC